jgi:hypothetical protein
MMKPLAMIVGVLLVGVGLWGDVPHFGGLLVVWIGLALILGPLIGAWLARRQP